MSNAYSQKLLDPRWQKKRLEIFQRDGWKCVKCGNGESQLHVHHKEYTNNDPWNEPSENLKTFCDSCHKINHFQRDIVNFLGEVGDKYSMSESEFVNGLTDLAKSLKSYWDNKKGGIK